MDPSPPPLELLSPFERFAVRLVRHMNRSRWQRLWFWCAREIGARWIALVTGPLVQVDGLEHVAATSRERPLLVVANHRSYFDLYVVMSVIFRRLPGWRAILFPVRGRYFYQRPGGLLANCFAAWWSMYPPFFHDRKKARFDQWALGELNDLCREGAGRLVGFHPEGTRNRDPDPYHLLPPQAGVGRLILEARPQVVPVFITGLGNSLGEILARRLRGGEPIRLRFGPAFDTAKWSELTSTPAASRAVAEQVMAEVGRLGEQDRRAMAAAPAPSDARERPLLG
jgi:1-acyl-sn-glycerol-3-phosphate acyltransferase